MIGLAKALLWLVSKLPAIGPYRLAQALAMTWMRLSPAKRQVAESNIRHCYPGLPPAARARMLEASFVHYLCSILETGRNWYWPERRLRSLCEDFAGEQMMLDALAKGRGVLLLAPHFGAWEYLGVYLQKHVDIAILYKPPTHPELEKILLQRRQRGGASLLPATTAGLRRLYVRLRAGEGVGVLPDQEPMAGHGRFAPFFGHPARTALLVPRLIQKTGCRVFFAACERLATGHYRIRVFPADEDINAVDIDTALAALNRGVEQCIAIDPAQYLWSYKRFRSRPQGYPPFYE